MPTAVLSEMFTNATSVRLMEHAATLDLEDFEDPELQDRLDRARRQTMGRMNLLSQLFGQVQDAVTVVELHRGPGRVRAVADRVARDRADPRVRRRVALQRAQLQAQLPVDARTPATRIPPPDGRERRDRQGSEDLQPAPVLHRALSRVVGAVPGRQSQPRAPARVVGHVARRASARFGYYLAYGVHRMAHGARAISASAT